MKKADFEQKQAEYIEMINNRLIKYLEKKGDKYDRVKDAMLYSIMAGGKRIRGMLTLEFAGALGAKPKTALDYACAIEMVHCYSLIHDDLPCMDNDDMRRGKPSCHKEFDEACAMLAGDALLTMAFEAVSDGAVSSESRIKAVKELAVCAGADGMIAGQMLDLSVEGKLIDKESLIQIYTLKTAKLLEAACVLGCCAAEVIDSEIIEAAKSYAAYLGITFQIIDDILDVIGDEKTLGKPIGSDKSNEKCTFVTLFGLESAKEIADEYTQIAFEHLKKINSEFLTELTKRLLTRRN